MKSLIVFSHLRWKFVFQRPQHLLTRLSRHYRVIFVEEPIKTIGADHVRHDDVSAKVTVVTPYTNLNETGFTDNQMTAIGPMVKQWLHQHVDLSAGYGIWFYTPQALPMKDLFEPELIIFDVMDELALFKGAPQQLKNRELELLKLADLVIAGGPSLYNAKKIHRPDTLCIPSAVDASHFTRHRSAAVRHNISHPRLGFYGVIDERLDQDLVAAIADADPNWCVVMVGPVVKIDATTLPQRSNIRWLGQQDYASLPQLVHEWDVCLMPFALNDSTKFISPTKTLEYMAAEKPVVSTAIHDVVELYGSVVEVGNTYAEFIARIRQVLAESVDIRQERIKNGLKIVAESSWDTAAEKVQAAIQDNLENNYK